MAKPISRSVNVTSEILSTFSGFEDDIVFYTATVLDSASNKLPANFVATLRIDEVDLLEDLEFDSSVYSQATGELSLIFIVPAVYGISVVALDWGRQQI